MLNFVTEEEVYVTMQVSISLPCMKQLSDSSPLSDERWQDVSVGMGW